MLYNINPRNFLEVLFKAISDKEECSYSGIGDEELVLAGKNEINENYCKENNIRYERTPNEGGTIVIQSGDIEFGKFKYNGFDEPNRIMNEIYEYLKEKGLNIKYEANDLLVDDIYKVGSCSSTNVGDRLIYTGCHISMSVNLEHIQNICLKPINKIPKGLNDYGIDVNELYQFINTILEVEDE